MRSITTAFTVSAVLACAARLNADTPVSLESLRAEHGQHVAAISSLVVVETVQTNIPRTAAAADRVYGSLSELTAERRARFHAESGHAPTSPEEELVAEHRFDEQHNANLSDEYMAVWEANESLKTQQRWVCDFQASRVRMEQRDLRDLDELAVRFAIPDSQMRNLDVTRTVISTSDYSLLVNRDSTLATITQASDRPIKERLELLGIVAAPLLNGKFPMQIGTSADGAIDLRANWPDSDQPALLIALRAEPGHHATYIARFKRDGTRIHEFRASDYRKVAADTWLPFKTETIHLLGGGMGERVEVREVQQVEMNTPVLDTAFDAPATAKINGMDPSASQRYYDRAKATRAPSSD